MIVLIKLPISSSSFWRSIISYEISLYPLSGISSPARGLPLIEIALYHGEHKKTVSALVDSGAAMSVLPSDTGLGLAWEKQTVPVDVGGVLKNTPAYGVSRRDFSSSPCDVGVCVGTSYK
jgi:hypothetical protein